MSVMVTITSPEPELPICNWKLSRFETLKIKIEKKNAAEFTREVLKHYSGRIRIDANEAFDTIDEYLQFEKKFLSSSIEFIEQPFPADYRDHYKVLSKEKQFPLMADESLISGDIDPFLANNFDGVNVKLMKAGGLVQAINQIKMAKASGMKVMLGCMIETTLGISDALGLASLVDYIDLDGFLYLKEDPFHLVEEKEGKLFYT